MNHFKGKQFQRDVIIVAVGYYLRYNLSYREVQEIFSVHFTLKSVYQKTLQQNQNELIPALSNLQI